MSSHVVRRGPEVPSKAWRSPRPGAIRELAHGQSSERLDPEHWIIAGAGLSGIDHDAWQTLAGSPTVWTEARRRISELTPRQRDVLLLVAVGMSNKEIAIELGLSPRTVEIHRKAMMIRLGARSTADAVRIAVYSGISEEHLGDAD
jgi:DNA-binding CsgD family transcriptional regulator